VKARSILITLPQVNNWPEIAAEVHYQAAQLAELWNVTPRTLQRQFRKELGTTPQKHLDAVRQTEAEKLIREGARTKEIAAELDYKQTSHFCRQFNNFHGMGARAWRMTAA